MTGAEKCTVSEEVSDTDNDDVLPWCELCYEETKRPPQGFVPNVTVFCVLSGHTAQIASIKELREYYKATRSPSQ